MLKLKLQYFGHLMQRTGSFEKTLMLGKIKRRREGDDRGWGGWIASPTRWIWVWVSSGSWWWTGKPGMLQPMGLQRVRHDWVTELNWFLFGKYFHLFYNHHFSSVTQSCSTLCNPMGCSMPGFPVLHQFPELAKIHVHWFGDAIQTSHPVSSSSPPAFSLSEHHGLFQWVSSSHQMAKVLKFSASGSVLPMNIQDWFPLGLIG